jgi:hypothetical protein
MNHPKNNELISEIEVTVDEIVLDRSDLLRAALRYLHDEGIISLNDAMGYDFFWCSFSNGIGLKTTRIENGKLEK